MTGTIVGIDLAKNSFSVHVANASGVMIKRIKKLSRSGLMDFVSKTPSTTIALEACGGAHHWSRSFAKCGHQVKMMAPQFVKPYVKADKTDAKDAAAISEAATRKHMNFVAAKNLSQQDMKMLHSIRNRLVTNKVQLTNEMRGLLLEYGIVAAKGDSSLKKKTLQIIEEGPTKGTWEEVTPALQREMRKLLNELSDLEKDIAEKDVQIKNVCESDEDIKQLMKIPGVGPVTASAIVAHVGDAKTFKSGRQFAAYFGLVPREHSTGGKTRLLGISKRGDKTIRSLLIHGARASLAAKNFVKAERREHYMQQRSRQVTWAHGLAEVKGTNKAAVALANKNARIIWAVLAKGSEYDPQHKSVRPKRPEIW